MNRISHIVIVGLCLPFFCLAEGGPKKDTTRLKTNASIITNAKSDVNKLKILMLVDSLLELAVIENQEIELISYYNSLLSEHESDIVYNKHDNLPATKFYDDFDENSAFQVTALDEFPELQIIKIESDSSGIYIHPRVGAINSKFGWRDGRMHKGIDINLNRGDAVLSAFDGMVRIASAKGAFGNVVIIRHYNGLETVYAHLSKIKVKTGQVVLAGQLVGLGGSTGRSSGPHLHFEVRFKGQALDPSSIISFTENKLHHDSIIIKKSRYGICAYPSNASLHTIERGDTWFEIAKRYGLSMKELCILNNTQKRYYLKIGQKLRVH